MIDAGNLTRGPPHLIYEMHNPHFRDKWFHLLNDHNATGVKADIVIANNATTLVILGWKLNKFLQCKFGLPLQQNQENFRVECSSSLS